MGFFILIFFTTLVACIVLYMLFRSFQSPEKKRVQEQLRRIEAERSGIETINIIRKKEMSSIPMLNRLLLESRSTIVGKMDRLVLQADTKYPAGVFILMSIVLFMFGYFTGTVASRAIFLHFLLGILLGSLPLFYLYFKKERRLRRFQEQLPDALDMIARALKAGHALTGGFQMVAQEFGEPISKEFSTVLDEINFGVSYEDALRNLSERFDSTDLRFFGMSVIIQRQTGGNLAEILENISSLIRERMKLLGRIRVLSAEGKMSAIVLVVLPFLIVFGMALVNPTYLPTLLNDPIGNILMAVSLGMMIVGILVMKKMIKIKV